jgi:hypothetical protein
VIEGALLVGALASWVCWNLGYKVALKRGRREGVAKGREQGYRRGLTERRDFARWEEEI